MDRDALRTPASPMRAVCVGLALIAFCALFVFADRAYYLMLADCFPRVGTSAALASLWGIVSRAHVLLPAIVVAGWRPRECGLTFGRTASHWRMIGIMLLVNCGVIAGYLWATGGGTPYSGNQWLLTEVVTVPVVEELMWRGVVFAVLMAALVPVYGEVTGANLAVWFGGLAFGALHVANALAGVPLAFAAIQALSAMVWGVMYGYARARTGSIYPSILLHAAMNLVVVLF